MGHHFWLFFEENNILMDTRDGDGIEAVLNMEENDMAKFEHDVALLQNASLKSYQC
jgi:shikimate O-hydroxycinnamoyltransferase